MNSTVSVSVGAGTPAAATVTRYTGPCECCPASGSGSPGPGGGSGDGGSGGGGSGESGSGGGRPPIDTVEVCDGRRVPRVIYVTFGGALAQWGTVALSYGSQAGDIHYWSTPTTYMPTILECGLFQVVFSISFCGPFVPEGDFFRWGTGQSQALPCYLVAASSMAGVVPVQSYDPFFAEDSGTIEYTGAPSPNGCPCAGQPWTMLFTDTPP